ncbi:MAG: 1-deoxy-D-xylulose-5-phosphate synthase, partial [Candidatus Latescibacterota bacterium]
LVGQDGPTHHGVFDIGYLRMVPNFVLMAPKDENELRHMLKTMIDYDRGPIALRMPRGRGVGIDLDAELEALEIGKAEVLREGKKVVILGYGNCVHPSLAAAALLEENKIKPTVVNMRFVKPLDTALLDELMKSEPMVLTVEENARAGGFGSAVLEYLVDNGYEAKKIRNLGIPDRYLAHAPHADLLAEIGLTPENIAQTVIEMVTSKRRFLRAAGGGGSS